MKKLIILILFILLASVSYSAAPTRQNNYTSGTTILSASVIANEDAIFNYLQTGVDTYADDTIVNADINSSANIDASKLNLGTVTQDMTLSGALTFSGNNTFAGTTIADLGTVTTADIDGGTIDGTTLGGASAVTITDMDCNGGTLDGVQVGGTTATGELIVNNASDEADGLGAQGTSGQYLQSAGAGANPTWSTVVVLSNSIVTVGYQSSTTTGGDGKTVFKAKWKKLAGVDTIDVYSVIYNDHASETTTIKVDVGGVNDTDTHTGTSPNDETFQLDISGLSDGSLYDITISLKTSSGSEPAYMDGVSLIGS